MAEALSALLTDSLQALTVFQFKQMNKLFYVQTIVEQILIKVRLKKNCTDPGGLSRAYVTSPHPPTKWPHEPSFHPAGTWQGRVRHLKRGFLLSNRYSINAGTVSSLLFQPPVVSAKSNYFEFFSQLGLFGSFAASLRLRWNFLTFQDSILQKNFNLNLLYARN